MEKVTKYIGLVMLAALGIQQAAVAAIPTQNKQDDLYSESIYIRKSSAETPGSLESNARKEEAAPMEASLPANDSEVSRNDSSKKSISN